MRELTTGPRVLLKRLRELMAEPLEPQARLDRIVREIAQNMVAEVCSFYILRADGVLELYATEGLNPQAVHLAQLRLGQGLVGTIAASARPLNLTDAQSHPAFAYLPETGEEAYNSFLGVPVLRAGRTLGVLVVQNRTKRAYREDEVEALETTAMVLAEIIATGDGLRLARPGIELDLGRPMSVSGHGFNDGIGLGHVVLHEPRIVVTNLFNEDSQAELNRLDEALGSLRISIDDMLSRRDVAVEGEHREVLEAYRMFAHDRGWVRRLEEAVHNGLTAEAAVEKVQSDTRARMVHLTDPYMRERLSDFDDLANRLLRQLMGRDVKTIAESLAKDAIIVDGDEGIVHLRPQADVESAYAEKVRFRARRQAHYRELRDKPAITKDGVDIALLMNAGLLVDLPQLSASGAVGIGLFRTELQFMVASTFPRSEQQERLYRSVIDAAGDKPVTFRTLDIGGDKVLPYFRSTAHEENPALGWRAIRLTLDRPGLLRTQLRALLKAAGGRELKLMLPMVTEVSEVKAAREIIEREVRHLSRFAHSLPLCLKLGAMVEVPALLWQLDELMTAVDFVSVGSNDLFQFLMAADRGNSLISDRFDQLSPSFLRALRHIVKAGARHEKPVTLCGEMAGRPLTAMTLIGLGFRSISMSAAAIGPVKAMLGALDAGKLNALLLEELNKPNNAHSLRELLLRFAEDNEIPL